MKKIYTQMPVMITLSLLVFECNKPLQEHKGVVAIINAQNRPAPMPDLAAHKPYDVEVYKMDAMDSSLNSSLYKFIYYQNENDSLRSHGAMFGDSNAIYNKAAYHWVKDTVCIRLYNDTSNKEVKFKLYGKGGSNGMMDDK